MIYRYFIAYTWYKDEWGVGSGIFDLNLELDTGEGFGLAKEAIRKSTTRDYGSMIVITNFILLKVLDAASENG